MYDFILIFCSFPILKEVYYIRTILITASRVEDCNNVVSLIRVARGAIAIERILHNHYFTIYAISRGEKSLECLNFTNFLLSTSYSNTYEAINPSYGLTNEVKLRNTGLFRLH